MQPRPLGPRSIHKPSPPSTGRPTTTPLIISKPQKPSLILGGRSGPPLGLQIPGAPPRSVTPKLPSIGIVIPEGGGRSDSGADSPLFESYYGGPVQTFDLNATATGRSDDITIRPPSSIATCVPQTGSSNGVVDVKGLVDNLSDAPSTWSDDVLEELSRLGEGAGGAVHKVKDKRTGKIMARKTITTREAPMKQLLRELSIISSTQHVNIIQFHGAYMSPSSSEVKIIMDLCEGGSLETVGKRIKERGAIVGESITGRLAEGVSSSAVVLFEKFNNIIL